LHESAPYALLMGGRHPRRPPADRTSGCLMANGPGTSHSQGGTSPRTGDVSQQPRWPLGAPPPPVGGGLQESFWRVFFCPTIFVAPPRDPIGPPAVPQPVESLRVTLRWGRRPPRPPPVPWPPPAAPLAAAHTAHTGSEADFCLYSMIPGPWVFSWGVGRSLRLWVGVGHKRNSVLRCSSFLLSRS